MNKYFTKYCRAIVVIVFLIANNQKSFSQTGCISSGSIISNRIENNNVFYSNGDLSIISSGLSTSSNNAADWLITSTTNVTVYASVNIKPGAIVRLKSGSTLNIYGDFINNGNLLVEQGANINFYGQTWTNSNDAKVGDGLNTENNQPGGTISFVSPRPTIPTTARVSICVNSNYSGGNFAQNIDGGNIPMDVTLLIHNNNNVNLINSNLRIEGMLVFDVINGDLIIGNNDLIFTQNGAYFWNIANAKDAYVVVNSRDNCSGMVEKKQLQPNVNFVFPIGHSEIAANGLRDFNPLVIQNNGNLPDNFRATVHTYAEAASQALLPNITPAFGKDRIWKITSTLGSPASVNMMHNASVSGTDYTTIFTETNMNSISQYNSSTSTFNTGHGPRGIGSGIALPSIAANVPNSYDFERTSTDCSNSNVAWYIKSESKTILSSDPQFTGSTKTLISDNFVMPLKSTKEENQTNGSFTISPNPSNGVVKISGTTIGSSLVICSPNGQPLFNDKVTNTNTVVDISKFANGTYIIIEKNESKKINIVKKITKL